MMNDARCAECLHFCAGHNIFCSVCKDKSMFEAKKPINEDINHPDRYKAGQYECIEVMRSIYGDDFVKHFCLGNAFKYLWRQNKKGGIKDVEKAEWYLNYVSDKLNGKESDNG